MDNELKGRNDDGFSLLELVVAVGVLLVLTVGGLLAYNGITKNARLAAVQKAASEVLTGAVAYDSNGDPYIKAEEEWMETRNGDTVRVSAEKEGDCITVRAWNTEHEDIESVKQSGTSCVGETVDDDGLNGGDNNDSENPGVIVGNEYYGAFYFDVVYNEAAVSYTVNVVRLDNNETVFTNNSVDTGDSDYEYFNFDLTEVEGNETIRIFGEVAGIPYSIVREVEEFWDPEIDYGSIKVEVFNDESLYFYDSNWDLIDNEEDPYDTVPDDESGGEEAIMTVNIDHSLVVDFEYDAIPDNCHIELYNLRTNEVIGSVNSCDANDSFHYYEFTEDTLYEEYHNKFNAYPFELRVYIDNELNSTISSYYVDTTGFIEHESKVGVHGDLSSEVSLVWLEDEQKFVNVWVGGDMEPNFNTPFDPNKLGSEIFNIN